jgi:hypothetical protein
VKLKLSDQQPDFAVLGQRSSGALDADTPRRQRDELEIERGFDSWFFCACLKRAREQLQ